MSLQSIDLGESKVKLCRDLGETHSDIKAGEFRGVGGGVLRLFFMGMSLYKR